jgi:RNA polymerase sigma factor (sigma-70 family)
MAIRQSGIDRQIQTLFDGGTVTGLSDEQLLEQFANRRGAGAEMAFAALVAKHGPMVLSVCRGLLRNPHDAEDAFQATFLVLALKAGSLRKPKLLGPWLHGVAHHTARRLRDKNARRKHREAEAAMSGMRAAENAGCQLSRSASHDEIEALHEEIERLPERYRTTIVLCDLQGLTHQEAAQRLGRPVGTVSARLSRARERLRGQLSRRGLALPAGVITAAMATSHASAMPATLVESTIKVAMLVSEGLTAGAVPASIASLSKGVLKSMFLTKLKMISATVLLAGAAAGSVAVVAQQGSHPRPAPRVDGAAPKTSGASPSRAAETGSDGESSHETELIVRSAANLRRIAGGIHAYLEANKDSKMPGLKQYGFPPPAILGADGKPLLSWRVAILPHLGEKALYAQFKLDEPWDGPHNKSLLVKMPNLFAPVGVKKTEKYATYYQGFVGPGALFERSRKVTIDDVTDGTSNTLMVVEAETPVPWTKPEDLSYVPGQPLPKLGGQFKDGFVALRADGFTQFIKRSIDPKLLNAVITRNGMEVINNEEMGEGITP